MRSSYLLFARRKFLPFFLTQLQTLLTGNLIISMLVVMATREFYENRHGIALIVLAAAGAALVIPSIFLSSIAGQAADKFDKTTLIRIIKGAEICLILIAAYTLISKSAIFLLATIFLFGVHAAFFSTVKYSILPQLLKKKELLTGNAFTGSGTFLAIFLGCALGNVLPEVLGAQLINAGIAYSAALGMLLSVVGFGMSFFIPSASSSQPGLKFDPNPITSTREIIKYSKSNKGVFKAIIGVSWFWMVGITFTLLLASFARNYLNADSSVSAFLLILFALGLTAGSFVSEEILRGRIDIKYVPVSALGMCFTILLLFVLTAGSGHTETTTLPSFLSSLYNWLIIIDICLFALFSGFYVVPLNTLIQQLSNKNRISRVIAANNIFNAIFMVAGVILFIVCTYLIGLNIPYVLLILGILNFGIAVYITKILPAAILKINLEWLLKVFYKVKVHGYENYEKAGKRVIIIANHTSLIDGLLLAVFLPGRQMFAINTQFFRKWYIRMLSPLIDFFPVEPTKPTATLSIIKEIRRNRKCIIFPEGRLTMTGALMKVYEGPATIAERSEANILPVRIDGALHTPFSRAKGKVMTRLFPKITISILPHRKFEIDNSLSNRARRYKASMKLYDIMTEMIFDSSSYREKIFSSLISAKKIYGKNHKIIEDVSRKPSTYKELIRNSFTLGSYLNKIIRHEQRAGILMPNTIPTLTLFLALHSHGKTPVLLNFSSGIRNVIHSIKIAGVKKVFTSRNFVESAKLTELISAITGIGISVIYLEDIRSNISMLNIISGKIYSLFPKAFFDKLTKSVSPDDPAVILFTSGSEGNPKGVALSHTNLQANRFQVGSKVDFNSSDIIFNALPLFHSFGLMCGTILPMLSGIKVFLYPSPLHYRIVPELVYDTNSTIMFGTDTFLLNYGKVAHQYDFYSIRYVFAGAEKLKQETLDIWNHKFGIRIFEGYGATETSPILSTNTPMECKIGSVGKLLPRIESRLEKFEGVEDGGKLFVKGPNIMAGYILSEETNEIIPLKNGWYDTGDVVRFDDDGFIFILGRVKRFAKIAGEMVSITQIEAEISQIAPEKLHAVISVPDSNKGEQLILLTESNLSRKEIQSSFREKGLSELSVPKSVCYVKNMPLLGSGKIDYQAAKMFVNGYH